MISTKSTKMKILAIIMRPGLRPSIREIMDEVGLAPNGVAWQLDSLKKMGLVTWEFNLTRTLIPLVRFIPVEELLCEFPDPKS
jgi:DNA-binding MarR family transcriptional regulator